MPKICSLRRESLSEPKTWPLVPLGHLGRMSWREFLASGVHFFTKFQEHEPYLTFPPMQQHTQSPGWKKTQHNSPRTKETCNIPRLSPGVSVCVVLPPTTWPALSEEMHLAHFPPTARNPHLTDEKTEAQGG